MRFEQEGLLAAVAMPPITNRSKSRVRAKAWARAQAKGHPITKLELDQRIAERNPHLFPRDVENIVNTILDKITEALAQGNRVELRGFGAFSVMHRDARLGRNPRKGAHVTVAEKAVSFFKTGNKRVHVENIELAQGLTSPPRNDALRGPAIRESVYTPGARAKALLKGIEIAEEDLLCSGGSYDLEQVRGLMHGVSRQRVNSRVREGSLLAVPGPRNKRRYPAAQFNEDGTVVEGLRAVLQALPTRNSFAVLNFLLHPDRRLADRKPIELLKAGEVGLVVEAARLLGEQGA